MRILHTINSLNLTAGGPTRTVTSLCTALATKGVDVNLISTISDSADSSRVLIPSNKLVHTTFVEMRSPMRNFLGGSESIYATLKQLCQAPTPIVIHDNGIWMRTNHSVISVARAVGVPLIVSPRGMLEPWALKHKALKKRVAWHLYQRRDLQTAAVLHATSEQEVESIRRIGLRQPIAMIPNGVQFPPTQEGPKRMTGLASPSNFGLGVHTALFLSRIHPKKGLFNLIDAWFQVKPIGWKLVIAGPDEGGHLKEVAKRISDCGLAETVIFVGEVEGEDKAALYRNADLFILPTFSENFGVVVAEALSYGVPVITTKGAPWSDLTKFECGWWVDIGVTPLAFALKSATSLSNNDRQAMGVKGYEYVKRYNWEDIASQMMCVYQWMHKLGPKPDYLQMN